MFAAIWTVVALPFRLVGWTLHWLGRAAAVILGLGLMVGGGVLSAGSLAWAGLPMFVVGLILTLRALG